MAKQDRKYDKLSDSVSQTIETTEYVSIPLDSKQISNFIVDGSEIEEIISSRLPFIVQWGTVIFSFIIVILALICWFIQYPDIITASGKINSVNAPREIITRTSGKLMRVLVKENDFVKTGEVLGYMESIARPQVVLFISKQIDTMNSLISENREQEIIRFLPNYNHQYHSINLGELQSSYQVFTEASIQFKNTLHRGFLQHKKLMLLEDLQNIKRMHLIIYEQKNILSQDLALSSETFEANKTLAENKVIALLDYRNEKSKLLTKKLTLPQINAAIVSNEDQLNAKKEEIIEIDNQINTQRYAFIQALAIIKSQIQLWEAKYLLKAPVPGNVAFTGFFQENQEMKIGQTLFYIQPKNSSYFIEIVIPQYNFGKIKLDQQVALKFQAYPFEQYGSVMGRIAYIDSSPTNGGYLAKIILPNGLVTNRKKVLRFRQGLAVQADIITEKMRLLERFYYDLTKQMQTQ